MQKLIQSVTWIISVLGTMCIFAGTIAAYALLCYLVYNDLALSLTLAPITFGGWFAMFLAYSAILSFKYDWVSIPIREQIEYEKETRLEAFIQRIKIIVSLILIAWIYGMVY